MKGGDALWSRSPGVGFTEIPLGAQHTHTHTPPEAQKRGHAPEDGHHLGSLGDLLAREILGDFLAAQSSLSSMSLESEQLQLSVTAEIKLFP